MNIDGELVRKHFTSVVKSVDPEAREATFIITTADADRDRDIIEPKGWKLQNFRKNPVVLWAHSHNVPPIAKAVSINKIKTKDDVMGLQSRAKFPPEGVYPLADQVFNLIREGFLGAASVGFRVLKAAFNEERGGIDFMEQELLEWSVVPVPANQAALLAAFGGKKMDVELPDQVKEALELVECVPEMRDAVLSKLMAARWANTKTSDDDDKEEVLELETAGLLTPTEKDVELTEDEVREIVLPLVKEAVADSLRQLSGRLP